MSADDTTDETATRAEPVPEADVDRLDGAALLSTVRAATVITSRLERALRESNVALHANDWDALYFLVAQGPMRPAELIRLTVLTESPATLHKILARLEERGLVTRSTHPDHARGVLYAATEDGITTIRSLWSTVERQVVHRFAGHFTDEELELLAGLTRRI